MIRDLERARDRATESLRETTSAVVACGQKLAEMTPTTPGLAYALKAIRLACERQRAAAAALLAANEAVLVAYDAMTGRVG